MEYYLMQEKIHPVHSAPEGMLIMNDNVIVTKAHDGKLIRISNGLAVLYPPETECRKIILRAKF